MGRFCPCAWRLPSPGAAPEFLCEALSHKLGRDVTLEQLGLADRPDGMDGALDWRVDTLVALTDLGRVDVDAALAEAVL
jgi:hypothetical protein